MMTDKTLKHPMGAAIADYYRNGVAGRLRVFSPDFEEDEIPLATLFRSRSEMPHLEQTALNLCQGRVLDVGAGAGCHSLALQDEGLEVTAVDIDPLSVAIMLERGVFDARVEDFWLFQDKFDTILMLMNGIGIVGTLVELPHFFEHIREILRPGGQVLLDSSDIRYVFEDEDGTFEPPRPDCYYGELTYQMQYKRVKGTPFPWLYIDFETLAEQAAAHGFCAELLEQGEHYDYLARLTLAV